MNFIELFSATSNRRFFTQINGRWSLSDPFYINKCHPDFYMDGQSHQVEWILACGLSKSMKNDGAHALKAGHYIATLEMGFIGIILFRSCRLDSIGFADAKLADLLAVVVNLGYYYIF